MLRVADPVYQRLVRLKQRKCAVCRRLPIVWKQHSGSWIAWMHHPGKPDKKEPSSSSDNFVQTYCSLLWVLMKRCNDKNDSE